MKSSLRPKLWALVVAGILAGAGAALPVQAQHDMHNMPGMGSKPKSKSKSKSKTATARRKQAQKRGTAATKGVSRPSASRASSGSKKAPARNAEMNMPGMTGMPAQATPAQPGATPGHIHQPGMQMPSSTSAPQATPSASPEKMDMSMPGMQMPGSSPQSSQPATAKPEAPAEKMEMSMPGMQMPAQTPEAQPVGAPGHTHTPGMQMPQAPATTPNANQPNPHTTHGNMSGMGNMDMGAANTAGQPAGMPGMNMPGMVMGSNGIFTSRSGSGTMWQPASTPMHMLHWQKGDWMVMMHGDLKLGVNAQGGPRGVTKFESQNWLMVMATRKAGPGTLDLRSMFSLEPLTLSGGGSPQLFQTGESYQGQPLRNAQHPHDLFMTLSASYTVPLGERGSWFAYFGMPGEPALGPVAFMHRASAAENPSAPLAHHLQDSTHISYGVFTTGFTYRWFKVEGSLFNGREPDENRYDIEFNPWTSRSFRVQFAPNNNWAAQVSYGFLKNPEALESGDVRRTTASLSYNKQLARGNWATTFIWGRNRESHGDEPSTLNGYTAESTLQFKDRNYLYTRLELVDKNGLLDDEDRDRLGIESHHPVFRIGAYTFGAARDVWETDKFTVALGGDVTFYSMPSALNAIYGDNPRSYHIFARFRLGRMSPDRSTRSKPGTVSPADPHAGHQP